MALNPLNIEQLSLKGLANELLLSEADWKVRKFLKRRVVVSSGDANLVVGQAVDNDEFNAASRAVVVDDKVFAGVDVLVVVEPADLGRRRSGHRARQGHLAAVRCHHVLQVLGELRRHQLLLGNWTQKRANFVALCEFSAPFSVLLCVDYSCACVFMLDVCSLLLPVFWWIKMNINAHFTRHWTAVMQSLAFPVAAARTWNSQYTSIAAYDYSLFVSFRMTRGHFR